MHACRGDEHDSTAVGLSDVAKLVHIRDVRLNLPLDEYEVLLLHMSTTESLECLSIISPNDGVIRRDPVLGTEDSLWSWRTVS